MNKKILIATLSLVVVCFAFGCTKKTNDVVPQIKDNTQNVEQEQEQEEVIENNKTIAAIDDFDNSIYTKSIETIQEVSTEEIQNYIDNIPIPTISVEDNNNALSNILDNGIPETNENIPIMTVSISQDSAAIYEALGMTPPIEENVEEEITVE